MPFNGFEMSSGLGGPLLMIGSLPLVIVPPEVGLPVILLALRLLAAELEWQPAHTPGSPGAGSNYAAGSAQDRPPPE